MLRYSEIYNLIPRRVVSEFLTCKALGRTVPVTVASQLIANELEEEDVLDAVRMLDLLYSHQGKLDDAKRLFFKRHKDMKLFPEKSEQTCFPETIRGNCEYRDKTSSRVETTVSTDTLSSK